MSDIWGTVDVDDVEIPVFTGKTDQDHVTAWRAVNAATQKNYWMFGAIAVSLERAKGGRPDKHNTRVNTVIQKFCVIVGVGRNDFQRYKRTYATFMETCTTGGTRYIRQLSFKHHEVAARFLDTEDAINAVAEASDKKWSANELERQLAARVERDSGPKPFYPDDAERKLAGYLEKLLAFIETWPADARRKVPDILRRFASLIERSTPPDPNLHYVRDVEEFGPDAPPQIEAVQ